MAVVASDVFSLLVGTWSGYGDGSYPGVSPFRYEEATAITSSTVARRTAVASR